MRSIVISALFAALPAAGVTCLRFNFRGVEGSDGFHDEGRGERLDVQAALRDLDIVLAPTSPMILTGWSFGADVALSTREDRIDAWFAVAPPFHYATDVDALAAAPPPNLPPPTEPAAGRSPPEAAPAAPPV